MSTTDPYSSTDCSTKQAWNFSQKVPRSGIFLQDLTRGRGCHVDQSADETCQFCHVACHVGLNSTSTNERLTRVICATWQSDPLPQVLPRVVWVPTHPPTTHHPLPPTRVTHPPPTIYPGALEKFRKFQKSFRKVLEVLQSFRRFQKLLEGFRNFQKVLERIHTSRHVTFRSLSYKTRQL